jgi:hypothetical protein
MKRLYRAFALMALGASILTPGATYADQERSPLTFFQGVTEGTGTLKVIMHNPTATRSVGRGEIEPDGSLSLVQRVDDGRPPHLRHWRIRQIAPGHFSGSMSEASGPVMIDQVDSRYRFRFKMSGGMWVEQWLTPLADGRSATTDMTVRKFGMTVASGHGVVRKIS